MVLDIGNVERIDNPSSEQLSHYLRFMPPTAPFLVLSASDDTFMQATPRGDAYRVEYRTGKRHRFMHVPLDRAVELLNAFRTGDRELDALADWRRLSVFTDSTYPNALWPIVIMILVAAALSLWSALH